MRTRMRVMPVRRTTMRTRAGRRASVAETQEPYYLKMQRLLGNRAVSRGGQHGASQELLVDGPAGVRRLLEALAAS